MKKGEKKTPHIFYDRLASLKPEERQQLRDVLTSPLWVKFLRIIEGQKPSANCAGAGSQSRDAFSNDRANARLGEIRGWELFQHSMFAALKDAPDRRAEPEDNFPEAGAIRLEPRNSS